MTNQLQLILYVLSFFLSTLVYPKGTHNEWFIGAKLTNANTNKLKSARYNISSYMMPRYTEKRLTRMAARGRIIYMLSLVKLFAFHIFLFSLNGSHKWLINIQKDPQESFPGNRKINRIKMKTKSTNLYASLYLCECRHCLLSWEVQTCQMAPCQHLWDCEALLKLVSLRFMHSTSIYGPKREGHPCMGRNE